MESSECESTDDTDAEQLAIVHCTSSQQSGGGSAPATMIADRLVADRSSIASNISWVNLKGKYQYLKYHSLHIRHKL